VFLLNCWTKQQRRVFRKVSLGIRKRRVVGLLRFLSLGSPPEFKGELSRSFSILKKRISRLTVNRLIEEGYISRSSAKYYYKGFDFSKTFPFSYVAVRTSEGPNGLYHIPYFGVYIPQSWLYDNWKNILGVNELANQSVDIRSSDSKIHDSARLAMYVVNQYVANQSALEYSSCSWSWVFRGFLGTWDRFYSLCLELYSNLGDECDVSFWTFVYNKWDVFLISHESDSFQSVLFGWSLGDPSSFDLPVVSGSFRVKSDFVTCESCHDVKNRSDVRIVPDTGIWVCYDCCPREVCFRGS